MMGSRYVFTQKNLSVPKNIRTYSGHYRDVFGFAVIRVYDDRPCFCPKRLSETSLSPSQYVQTGWPFLSWHWFLNNNLIFHSHWKRSSSWFLICTYLPLSFHCWKNHYKRHCFTARGCIRSASSRKYLTESAKWPKIHCPKKENYLNRKEFYQISSLNPVLDWLGTYREGRWIESKCFFSNFVVIDTTERQPLCGISTVKGRMQRTTEKEIVAICTNNLPRYARHPLRFGELGCKSHPLSTPPLLP